MVGEDRQDEPEVPDQSPNPACQKQPHGWWGITVNHHCGLRIWTNLSPAFQSSRRRSKTCLWATHWENARWLCRFGPSSGGYLGHIWAYQRRPVYTAIFVNALFESYIIPPNDPFKYRDATMSMISKVYSPKVIMKCLGRALWFPGSRFIFLVLFCSS